MKSLRNIVLVIILFAGVVFTQFYFDRTQARQNKPSPYVPSSQVVKFADLGLDSAASSLYWLAAIQYLGDWQTDGYQKLTDYITLSNDLDPRFPHPYAFAVLVLPGVNQLDQAIKIGQNGIKNADPDWEIPYYLGLDYYMYQNDAKSASQYFDIAARTAGAPDNLKWIAANFGSRPDLRANTEAIWQAVAENSKDAELQKRAEIYLYHFKLLDFLEQAAAQYKQQYGTYPDPLDQMVEGRILKEVPKDPFGYQIYIDSEGRARLRY